jgi:hypothetical protein
MDHHQETASDQYPHGRGYGHDYMRGGEVFGGYGYADRDEYAKRRGELQGSDPDASGSAGSTDGPDGTGSRT